LLLVLATHWPNPWSPGSGPRYPDKLVHLAAYTVLAFLVVPVIRRLTSGNKDRFRVALVFSWVAVAAFGLLDETTQPLTGRDFEWFDWLADSVGAACGLALGRAWFRGDPNKKASRRGHERGNKSWAASSRKKRGERSGENRSPPSPRQ